MAPLVVITGPTASGKSAIALRLAERWGGEIICADSRTVYKGLDIGTAKPSVADQLRVRHHLLDVVEPNTRFTVHDFQQKAEGAIADIRARHKIPLLVGGTGLYIDSVVLGFQFGTDMDIERRNQLQQLSVNELQSLIIKQQIQMPENDKNKRYLIRALERIDQPTSISKVPSKNTYVVAISTEKHELQRRIEERAHEMIEAGVIAEALRVAKDYGWDCEAMTGNIYTLIRDYCRGELTMDMLIAKFIIRDRQLAKRQITWLKRHAFVRWYDRVEAEQYFDHILRKYRDACSD